MKKKRPYNLRTRIIQQLRKIFFYSPLRREALDGARVLKKDVIMYRCAITKKLFPIDQVTVDHIDPVVKPEEGFPQVYRENDLFSSDDWTEYVNRLFCKKENLQVISKIEHSKKTKLENKERRKHGKGRK